MSITQPITGRSPSDNLGCPRCNAVLPAQATFCGICGERIDRNIIAHGEWGKDTASSQNRPHRANDTDIATRYRITSLVRRRPNVNLFFALDNRQQRMVAIRDIDISGLDEQARANAIELVESEYDLLRRLHIPYVMPVIDLRHFQKHIFVIASSKPHWEISLPRNIGESSSGPVESQRLGSNGQVSRLYTLQDLLQSGMGLPPEQTALDWVNHLCQSLDTLHKHQIVVGDLDPYTMILNTNSYESQPSLMVSWLLPQLRSLLPPTSTMTNMSYFSAPEALLGNAEPRSDIYSLGAILYLLLTGTPPDEPEWRNGSGSGNRLTEIGRPQSRQRLRSVRELNTRISSGIDECIMRALSMDLAERFQNGEEMAEALRRGRAFEPSATTGSGARRETTASQSQPVASTRDTRETEEVDETTNVDTVRIMPLSQKNLERWQSSRLQGRNVIPHRPRISAPLPQSEESAQSLQPLPASALHEALAETDVATVRIERGFASAELPEMVETEQSQAPFPRTPFTPGTGATWTASSSLENVWSLHSTPMPDDADWYAPKPLTLPQRMKLWITGKIPTLRSVLGGDTSIKQQTGAVSEEAALVSSPARRSSVPSLSGPLPASEAETSFLKQIQRFVLGQQHHTTTAAAIIETPLRVQPNQEYAIRLHLIGRDEVAFPPGARKKDVQSTGLSALIHGEQVLIEVRSALHQNFAYIVQQASVRIPAHGYEAEVTIPMQPLSMGPSGRRDRLHIFFMDEQRRPLYEKPFVVEIFISHLVQPGREGHNVLTLPY